MRLDAKTVAALKLGGKTDAIFFDDKHVETTRPLCPKCAHHEISPSSDQGWCIQCTTAQQIEEDSLAVWRDAQREPGAFVHGEFDLAFGFQRQARLLGGFLILRDTYGAQTGQDGKTGENSPHGAIMPSWGVRDRKVRYKNKTMKQFSSCCNPLTKAAEKCASAFQGYV